MRILRMFDLESIHNNLSALEKERVKAVNDYSRVYHADVRGQTLLTFHDTEGELQTIDLSVDADMAEMMFDCIKSLYKKRIASIESDMRDNQNKLDDWKEKVGRASRNYSNYSWYDDRDENLTEEEFIH